jgi:phosphatidylserine decarboxylase
VDLEDVAVETGDSMTAGETVVLETAAEVDLDVGLE